MHISILFGLLLELTWALPNLYEDNQISSATEASNYSLSYVSGQYTRQTTSQEISTSYNLVPSSKITSSPTYMQSSTTTLQATEVMTRTWLTTVTQTSFIPVSTLVTESGSIIYYSTWLSVVYPTSVITATEYITGSIGSVIETTVITMSLWATSTAYDCICPSPTIDTVYICATIGPVMTVTSAMLLPYKSIFSDQLTAITAIPTGDATSIIFSSEITASSPDQSNAISATTDVESSTVEPPKSSSVKTVTGGYGNTTSVSGTTGSVIAPMVSQLPNGQLIVPHMR